MIILQVSDFEGGKYSIPDAGNPFSVGTTMVNNVQACIDEFEKPYIYQLLGVTEGDKIIDYLAASRLPDNPDYNKVIDGFSTDNETNACCGSNIYISKGMKEYLKACISYEYNKNSLVTSLPGITQPVSETASIQAPVSSMRFAENQFNQLLATVEAIQWYCRTNYDKFPDFNGQCLKVKASNIF